MTPDRICVGAIAGSFGVSGEVRLKSFCTEPEDVAAYGPLWTEDGSRSFTVKLTRASVSGGLGARLSGIATKEQADALKGTSLYADRDRLPSLPDDEYYHADLLGLPVGAFYVAGVALALWLATEYTPLGRALYVIGANPKAAELNGLSVRRHDLTGEDSSLGVNVASLDMINERFIRTFRLGLLEMLRTTPRINPRRVEIVRFGDYLKSLTPPLSVNMVRMNPLRGNSLVVIDPTVVFSSLDSFFGGFGRGVGQLPSGRLFTPTELRIIKMILDVFFKSLKDAWAPVMDLEFDLVSQEINPQFAQIADENDLVILTRFESESGPTTQGFIDLVYPYSSLKPVRDLLRSQLDSALTDRPSEVQWELARTDRPDADTEQTDGSVVAASPGFGKEFFENNGIDEMAGTLGGGAVPSLTQRCMAKRSARMAGLAFTGFAKGEPFTCEVGGKDAGPCEVLAKK